MKYYSRSAPFKGQQGKIRCRWCGAYGHREKECQLKQDAKQEMARWKRTGQVKDL